ncbi:carbonic anhydrase [Actinoplanes xinjiangensis]|uniref:carbonic anhydrase n=2 Tax=Actinoplanes xinjiangensis TaxID=512350 RepID=A0A316FTG9_9ACTN|nr:carbonic anhydrase [Actinoplanes xinjiangensis]PWK51552.1 carbonic anhydrase [Actinoplanes xinjiangensis]GIF35913.1 carbonic anhydrase [Actinoplanes xinjiangensis]
MLQSKLHRRHFLGASGAVAGSIALGGLASSAAMATEPGMSPEKVLANLMAGNKRFISGKAKHPHLSRERIGAIAKGQHPVAIILSCADSRVAPELLFDQGLGDLFVNRVAGNVVDSLLLGSMEYAAEEFVPPLVMVLGHERCGAVAATQGCVRSGGSAPGHIQTIVDALTPVVGPYANDPDAVEKGVQANVKAQAAALLAQSAILREKVEAGHMKVVGARYDLDSAKVTLLG